MGNWQWQARVCCKGETSLNEEIRLAAGKASSFRPSVDLHGSEGELPKTGPRLACRSEAPGAAPTLVLKILSSTALPANSALRITAEGYEYSLRDARDGMTYFGCKKRSHGENSLKGDILNDVIMPLTDKEAAEKHRGRQFEIAYKPAQLSYWIRDLGVGFGAFLRLDEKARLRDNTLINIGESFVVVNLEAVERASLKVKLFGGPCKGEVFHFAADDFADNFIHIGRAATNEIHIDDNLISKCHSSIFHESGVWYVSDGDLEKGRGSTNGTW